MSSGDLPSWAKAWQVIDDAVYSVEKIIVTVFSVIMVLSVFVAVTWTTLASPNSKLAFIFSGSDDADQLGHIAAIILWLGVCILGAFTAMEEAPTAKKVGLGSVVAGLTIGAGLILVEMLPNGLIFAQRLALALLLVDGDAGMFDGNLYPSSHCTSGNTENRPRREASCPLFVVVAFGGRIRLLFNDCRCGICGDQLC